MNIGDIDAGYIGHVTFLFRGPDGMTLLADPYFADGFWWNAHRETRSHPPALEPGQIKRCDCIFISHIHGDHCDVHAVAAIAAATNTKVLACAEVLESLANEGVAQRQLLLIGEGTAIRFGSLRLTPLGGYDGEAAVDSRGRPCKHSLLLESPATRLAYCGDCHSMPPALNGQSLDAIFCWTIPHALEDLARLRPRPSRLVIMHCDQHQPGDFWCSRDPQQEQEVARRCLPGCEVIIPQRLTVAGLPRMTS